MNILLYYQVANRSIFLESLVEHFIKRGHKVFFLTTCDKGILHNKISELGAQIEAHPSEASLLKQVFTQTSYLIRYCRKHQIDVVYSHLQFANLIGLLAQRFIKAKVVPCRHHVDEVAIVANSNAMRIDWLVNKLAKKIVVVSNASKQYMTKHEKVPAEKIEVIFLGYNFNRYEKPNADKVASIRRDLDAKLVLIIVARMTKDKRHHLALEAVKQLISEGFDIKLLVLGSGPEESKLKAFAKSENLENQIVFTGFLDNTIDYVSAADLLISPSIIESSNQVVKEAALVSKPSLVCAGIGDFDEYIKNHYNGLTMTKENTLHDMINMIRAYYSKKEELTEMGQQIRIEVLSRFDIQKIGDHYLALAV